MPVALPKGVEVKLGDQMVEVKGPKGTLHTPVCGLLQYELADGHVTLTRREDTRESRAQHGLRRTLLANCVEGVSKGFAKTMEVIGVGYKVAVKGNVIELSVGFSHPVLVELPKGLEAKVEGQKLTISGIDKEMVLAAQDSMIQVWDARVYEEVAISGEELGMMAEEIFKN